MARSDHVHPLPNAAQVGAAAASHSHPLPTAAEVGAAPASHVGAGGSTHASATTSTDGFLSAADKSKLDGMAVGATAYVHPVGDGNLHLPATGAGSNGKVLKAGATAGSATWGTLSAAEVGAAASAHSHPEYLTAAPVTSVAGRTGAISLSTADMAGLGGAALLDVGTAAGTVAAGEHTHPEYAGGGSPTAWFPATLPAQFTDSWGRVWLASGNTVPVSQAPMADLAVWGVSLVFEQRTSSFGNYYIYGVTYGNGLFVATGGEGKLATSPDGITWTQRMSGIGANAITYGNGLFVAGGNGGVLATASASDAHVGMRSVADFGTLRCYLRIA